MHEPSTAPTAQTPAKQPRAWVPRVRQTDVWQLTPDELALYLRIAYHARSPRWLCVASTKTLCDSGLSDTKVRAAKKTLQAKKRIKITRRLNQTDQITIVNPVLDHRDVSVPLDVVRRLRPSELAIYCRIADRDRGTGCKAQNKELATSICSVRQVAHILGKLENGDLIRRYEADGKRYISSCAYGFKAHAAHLAELEKQAAEACNLGVVPMQKQPGTKGNIGVVTPCNLGVGKEVPQNQFPEKELYGSPQGDAKTHDLGSNGSELVPTLALCVEVLTKLGKIGKQTAPTDSGLPRALERKWEDQWRQCLDAGHTLRDLLKVDIANIDAPHVPWLAKHLATAIQHTQGNHQRCSNLRGKGCDSVFHWTRDGRVLVCPRYSGKVGDSWTRDKPDDA